MVAIMLGLNGEKIHRILYVVLVVVASVATSNPTAHIPRHSRVVVNTGDIPGFSYSDYKDHGFTHEGVSSLGIYASYHWLTDVAFPNGSTANQWRLAQIQNHNASLKNISSSGLHIVTSMDIFVIPATLFSHYKANMTTKDNPNRIALNNFTLALMAGMIDEMFQLFPLVDAVMVRVGENYGGPSGPVQWVGNGAVDFSLSFEDQQEEYRRFMTGLRESICVKHNKLLIFRTWDTSGFGPRQPARLHPSLPYYLNVTNGVEPHVNLIISIKHVALDFWRFVNWNPTIAKGKHQQLIEVECAREYEGKGAMPSYIGDGVINGFSEMKDKKVGMAQVVSDPHIVGMWFWSSGGGWFGPYVKNLLWPQLNAMVISKWFIDATNSVATLGYAETTEEAAFLEYCSTIVDANSCAALHNMALLSQDAILATRYCTVYDWSLQGSSCGSIGCMPANNWIRDNRLGGLQLLGVKDYYGNPGAIGWLYNHTLLNVALEEKRSAIRIWEDIVDLSKTIKSPIGDVAVNSSRYGLKLSQVVYYGWEIMSLGYAGDRNNHQYNATELRMAISNYDNATLDFNSTVAKFRDTFASTFYDFYEGGKSVIEYTPGLGASVDAYRNV